MAHCIWTAKIGKYCSFFPQEVEEKKTLYMRFTILDIDFMVKGISWLTVGFMLYVDINEYTWKEQNLLTKDLCINMVLRLGFMTNKYT